MYKKNGFPRRNSNFLKIILMSLMCLVFVSCTVTSSIEELYSKPWDGFTSTKPPQIDGVYIITDAEHLAWLSIITIFETHIRFDANIDMGNKNFRGIKHFGGIMDGNGKSIRNLVIEDETKETLGLIHLLTGDGSEIKNLIIENGSIKGKKDVGAFVGESRDLVTLTGLTNKSSVETAENSAGGIISFSRGDIKINNVQNSGEITGALHTGGIIGFINSRVEVTIDNTENTGVVSSATGNAAGIIGMSYSLKLTINNTKNSGEISSATGIAAGVISYTDDGVITINNTKNSGEITGTRDASGIVGYANSTVIINNTKNTGEIIGKYSTGGIIGYAPKEVTINKVENFANITGENATGGIIGNSTAIATIENAGNSGTITGTDKGGMIGKNTGTLTINCAYNYQNMRLIGNGGGTITKSYRSKDSPGINTTALTVDEFRNQNSFVDWDFNTIWKMGADYPILR